MEEIIDAKIVLSMRALYQSKVGLGLMDKGWPFITADKRPVEICCSQQTVYILTHKFGVLKNI